MILFGLATFVTAMNAVDKAQLLLQAGGSGDVPGEEDKLEKLDETVKKLQKKVEESEKSIEERTEEHDKAVLKQNLIRRRDRKPSDWSNSYFIPRGGKLPWGFSG